MKTTSKKGKSQALNIRVDDIGLIAPLYIIFLD